jgi:3-hydroxyisobutyrate dehydrogenase-like beta-hydroxyacid dehydrogenase
VATSSPSEPIGKVGFIGLGDMGGGIVARIIEAGWPTVLWARRPESLEGFDAANVAVAETPAALAAEVDLVGVCVWADDDVREVVAGDEGVLAGCRRGTVIAIHSSVAPASCRELAEIAQTRGVDLLDAPVSGGRQVALDGALTVAVGGDEAALARSRPVFESFAGTIVHLGGVGAAQAAKLVNNALFAANLAVADDALALGEELGIDASALAEFVRAGSGRSYALDVALRARASAEMRQAARPALEKDLRSLDAEVGSQHEAGAVLRDTASDGVDRLRR